MKLSKRNRLLLFVPLLGGQILTLTPAEGHIPNHTTVLKLQDTLSWDTKLRLDSTVITGELKNGFKYFIRKNTEPEKRVTMYLAVKAGSILETEEELGLAHFLEHMNFNGLKHFPKNELVNYLQKAGVRFGSDLNAYTSFDETIYQLPIPSDDPELLKNGLQVMRDWAQDALLDSVEIEKERGVIMEEMRGGRNAQQRMRDQYLPILLNGSLYAKRLPIGTEEIVTTFKPEVIRNFHEKWYRPDLQSIIIVGDIDPKEIETEVKRLFSDMTVPKAPKDREKFKVDLLNKNQFIAVTDPEMQYTVGQIIVKQPEEKVVTVRDYRKSLLKSVYNQMINARLSELTQSNNPPFLQSSVGISGFIGSLDNLSAFFVAKDGQFEEGFKALVRELERAKKFGFTQTEFNRAVADMGKGVETSYIERDKRKSDSYVNGYLDYFLNDNVALSNEDDYRIGKQLLPTLTLKEVDDIGNQYYTDKNRDIIIMAPESVKDSLPKEAKVENWIKEVQVEEIAAYEDNVSELPLLSTSPGEGKITEERNINGIEAKELTLSNGVKVILKPTDFKNDQILFRAFSPGGTSQYSDDDYYSAIYASSLINSSGLGQLNNIELQKYLTGKNLNVSPSIGEQTEGLSGNTDKEGLETTFEMIYGYFNEPRIEDDVFESTISRMLSSMKNRENTPSFVFSEAISKSLYGGNIRRMPMSEEGVKSISKEKALAIYHDRYADASDFTFTFVGSFDENELKPLIEKYIATLPTKKRNEVGKDLGLYEPAKGFEKVVHKGKEAKAQVVMSYFGDYTYNDEENLNMDALEKVLSIKLTERLREDESGVYGTGAFASYSKKPRNRFSFQISFGTSIDKYNSLINSALDEIRKVKENGPLETDLEKFVIEQKRQYEVQKRTNEYWLGEINSALQNDRDPSKITEYLEDLNKVTVKSVQEVAKKYLKDEQLFKFILLPDEVANRAEAATAEKAE